MVNITAKSYTHRMAVAGATVKVSRQETISAVREGRVPKGDVFAAARTAALLAAKRTAELIPDCHPLPVEFADVQFSVHGLEIRVRVEIQTVYKTGVEVEAMHAASVAALTVYDMLKPLDEDISIERIRLEEKSGGKGDYVERVDGLQAAVIVCSDSIAAGKKEDRAGKEVSARLEQSGIQVTRYAVIPDEVDGIQRAVRDCVASGLHLVALAGGTGLSPRDVTTEAVAAILDRRIPGIEEAMRSYGQQRTPYAMLSRSAAGLIGNTLVLALPGSTRGAAESMDAVFPQLLHLFRVMRGSRHEKTESK